MCGYPRALNKILPSGLNRSETRKKRHCHRRIFVGTCHTIHNPTSGMTRIILRRWHACFLFVVVSPALSEEKRPARILTGTWPGAVSREAEEAPMYRAPGKIAGPPIFRALGSRCVVINRPAKYEVCLFSNVTQYVFILCHRHAN